MIIGDAAVADIDELIAYIAQDKPGAAADMYARLRAAARGLADFPEQGQIVGRFRQLATVRPYLIRYRILRNGSVLVVAVRHAARRR